MVALVRMAPLKILDICGNKIKTNTIHTSITVPLIFCKDSLARLWYDSTIEKTKYIVQFSTQKTDLESWLKLYI